MTNPKVVVLCTNSEGAPEFHTCAPKVTKAELEAGRHYNLAMKDASDNGYDEPMVAFDETDPAAKQMAQVLSWQSPGASAGDAADGDDKESMRAQYNAAIDFALGLDGIEGKEFLLLWREGVWDEIAENYPEFTGPVPGPGKLPRPRG